tara:strand:+ start:1863 stop:2243 length:381 start_codon:yes stop_codon:yes gene_type:complete
MTTQEFENKYDERFGFPDTQDMLMRVASNLSDLHIEKSYFTPEQMDNKLNNLKEYIFDYKRVLYKTNGREHKFLETDRERAQRLLEEVKDATSELEELGPDFSIWQNAQASHKILKKANKDLKFVG